MSFIQLYCNIVIYNELIDSQLTKEHYHPRKLGLGFDARERDWVQQVCHC